MDLLVQELTRSGIPGTLIETAVPLLRKGVGVGALLEQPGLRDQPAPVLLTLVQAARRVLSLEREIAAGGIPRGFLDHIVSGAHLAGLRCLPPDGGMAPEVAADLVLALISEAFRTSRVTGEVADSCPSSRREEALGLCSTWTIEDLPSQRWLAWSRLERAGVLSLRWTWNQEALLGQLAARGLSQGADNLLPGLLPVLEPGVRRMLQDRALVQVLQEAVPAYEGLLTSAPLGERPLLAVFVGTRHQALAAVVIGQDDRILSSRRFQDRPGWTREFSAFASGQAWVRAVVPLGAADPGRLQELRKLLPRAQTLVRTSGLSEAREHFQARHPDLDRETLSAWILAHRAIAPREAWSCLPPRALGLVEYGNDIEDPALWSILEEVKVLAEVRAREERGPAGPRLQRTVRLNPLITDLGMLRPGMEVDCQVTNLTSFGAFVDLGLPEEGLIHISRLAAHRVERVSDVVRLGQVLRARVVEVDIPGRKIGLSLVERGPDPRDRRGQRARALNALDELFKKNS